MRNFFVFLIIVIIIVYITINMKNQYEDDKEIDLDRIMDRTRVGLVVNDHTLKVEIVNTPASIVQGLGDRTELGSDGMLFVLPYPKKANFWMKNMHFNLDFIWIKDYKIVDLHENIEAPQGPVVDSELDRVEPNQVVDLVLEVPAGKVRELQLQRGQNILFERLK